ncbi:MAG TPA: putative zinc-binding metallopeptidase [Solirubrobacteraceae bacterium]|nr:putative zinc-binding metallopeptidase [Solirubrobacteraceae bacterium]
MRSFACGHCGGLVFFENTVCLRCSTPLRFDAELLSMVSMEPGAQWIDCANRELVGCNWLAEHDGELCRSCRLTRTRPGNADAAGLEDLAIAERAKRRVLVQLIELGLPGIRHGALAFDLLSSAEQPVTTGHADGVITIDLAESDDARREARRAQLGEPYRTMLGHLRHELGHYMQPLLVVSEQVWAECRRLFGDDGLDYGEAVERHYVDGPPVDWQDGYVSAYATMHPWEDWAETFAHYLHITDTLETAHEFGVVVAGPRAVGSDDSLVAVPPADPDEREFAAIIESWLPLTYALNAINRSMGRDDLYPFALARPVVQKLSFVHQRVLDVRDPS